MPRLGRVIEAITIGVILGAPVWIALPLLWRDALKPPPPLPDPPRWLLMVKPAEPSPYYERWQPRHPYDSCMDLVVSEDVVVSSDTETTMVKHDVQAALFDTLVTAGLPSLPGRPSSYLLIGRSSLSVAPFMLASNPALIDGGFRGNLSVPVLLRPGALSSPAAQDNDRRASGVHISALSRIVQLC